MSAERIRETDERRTNCRYNPDVPVEIELDLGGNFLVSKEALNNISADGMSFKFGFYIESGKRLKLNIPLGRAVFAIKAEVMWCHGVTDDFSIGVRFIEPSDIFKARIFNQICMIERYKVEVFLNEGRDLTFNEAAREWIERFAGNYPAEPSGIFKEDSN